MTLPDLKQQLDSLHDAVLELKATIDKERQEHANLKADNIRLRAVLKEYEEAEGNP